MREFKRKDTRRIHRDSGGSVKPVVPLLYAISSLTMEVA
jgi:hypothetical protein